MKTSTRKNTSPPQKWQTLGKWYFKWTCCGPSSLKTLFLLMAPPKKEKKFTWNHHVIHLVDLWYLLLPKNPTKADSQTPTLSAERNRETFKWRNSIELISGIGDFQLGKASHVTPPFARFLLHNFSWLTLRRVFLNFSRTFSVWQDIVFVSRNLEKTTKNAWFNTILQLLKPKHWDLWMRQHDLRLTSQALEVRYLAP